MALKDIFGKFISKKEPQSAASDQAPLAKTVAPKEPEKPRIHWEGDMVPRETGPGEKIERSGGGGYSFCGTVRLEWVSRQTDAEGKPLRVRAPKGVSHTVPEVGFMAAGRLYASRAQLTARREREDSPWFKDVYGRDVLALTERFPCFDSSDFLYEKRYFRWYFLCLDGKLICVYHTDETPVVTVTEDVRDVEEQRWKEMKKAGCFEGEEI